ncbi:tetratricopeptide repeat-containing hybrid sensor histidine kinase/response regulator [Autumnicola musiva]|uniref:histidine kinase n=1 Tax=Autumnicola musiva TaxID=3075589 RepID=A0ABU3D2M6_9FLAO|nr:ATP-binding protein [Zunongwangia sp. F117]MDT0675779.1 ATP-binding protein [Zunongwangia sp. F117]
MKNLTLSLFFCLVYFYAFAFQNSKAKNEDETGEKIQRLLNDAESSILRYNFDGAIKKLDSSIALSKSINHERYLALSNSILANLQYIQHDFDAGTKSIKEAISLQEKTGDNIGLAYSYIQYAKILDMKGEFGKAKEYLSLAEDIYQKNDNREQLGLVALNRGILQIHENLDYKAALDNFHNAEVHLSASDNAYEKSRLNYFKASANISLNNLDEAEKNIRKSLEISHQHSFGGMIVSGNKKLSEIFEIKKQPDSALAHLQASFALKDSIYNMNEEELANEANSRYGHDALKNTLSSLTLQNAEQEKSLKVNKLTTILSVALITILSLLTLSLYKNNNLRARANDLLQKKNTELTLAKENAEKASLAKAQFLSTITHELRTPLYAVTGLTHLLLEESPTENQKEHLNSLKFSGEYLLSLINNILDLNKLEANKVELMETTFNLKRRISDVLIALKNSADEKGTKIHFNFDNSIPNKLKGDPLKISQILINLIGNSIKFTENGDIWINITKLEQNDKYASLGFEIRDNGEGISKEKQKAIFENFTQGSTQINRKFGGTGLGLSIVKNLLSLLNSEINLESELGNGSKFTFKLQFEVLETATATGPKKQEEEKIEAPSNDIMIDKKILIVEDNKINQMITRKILEKNKVNCDVADNGTIAIDKIKNSDFDLILMDIHMPGISGIEATVEIRKFNKEIPVIALTAVTLDENLDEFYLNGFNDIIPKPYKTEEFFTKINKHLAARETV